MDWDRSWKSSPPREHGRPQHQTTIIACFKVTFQSEKNEFVLTDTFFAIQPTEVHISMFHHYSAINSLYIQDSSVLSQLYNKVIRCFCC